MQGKSSFDTIINLTNLNIDRNRLSQSVIGILSQKLLPKLCNDCKQRYLLPPEKKQELFKNSENQKIYAYCKIGCPTCANTGYKGSIAIQELLSFEDDIQKLIFAGKNIKEIKNYLYKREFQDMRYDEIKKEIRGLIDIA